MGKYIGKDIEGKQRKGGKDMRKNKDPIENTIRTWSKVNIDR